MTKKRSIVILTVILLLLAIYGLRPDSMVSVSAYYDNEVDYTGGIELSGIKISGATAIKRTETSTYTIVCDPVEANCEVTWESLTPNLVSVDQNGVVTAKNVTGYAFIQATTTDGKYVATFAIRVTP